MELLDSSLDPACSLPSYLFSGEGGFWSATNGKDLLLCLACVQEES